MPWFALTSEMSASIVNIALVLLVINPTAKSQSSEINGEDLRAQAVPLFDQLAAVACAFGNISNFYITETFDATEGAINIPCQQATFINYFESFIPSLTDSIATFAEIKRTNDFNATRNTYVTYPNGTKALIRASHLTPNCYSLNHLFTLIPPFLGRFALTPVYPDNLDSSNAAWFWLIRGKRQMRINLFESEDLLKRTGSTYFDPQRRTLMIIHGWTDRYFNGSWQSKVLKILQKKSPDTNIIIPDWSRRAQNIFVNKVAANSRIVAWEMYNVLINLKANNVSVLSHSFGSNIAAILGTLIKNSKPNAYLFMNSIYAIDPSDQCFGRGTYAVTGVRVNSRLDYLAAERVSIVHTNGHLFGMQRGVGTINIFLNGGEDQPRCSKFLGLPGAVSPIPTPQDIAWYWGCNHYYGVVMATIDFEVPEMNGCLPIAYSCASYQQYLDGECNTCSQSYYNKTYDVVQIGYTAEDLPKCMNAPCSVYRSAPACALAGFSQQIAANASDRVVFSYTNNDEGYILFRDNLYIKTTPKIPFCAFHYAINVQVLAMPRDIANVTIIITGKRNPGSRKRFRKRYNLNLALSAGTIITIPAKTGQQAPFEKIAIEIKDQLGFIVGWPTSVDIPRINVKSMNTFDGAETPLDGWFTYCLDTAYAYSLPNASLTMLYDGKRTLTYANDKIHNLRNDLRCLKLYFLDQYERASED